MRPAQVGRGFTWLPVEAIERVLADRFEQPVAALVVEVLDLDDALVGERREDVPDVSTLERTAATDCFGRAHIAAAREHRQADEQSAFEGREQVEGQRPGPQDPAQRQRGDRENQRVPAAPPVRAAQEQRGEHQVEHHLVGQRPHHVGHRRRPQHALQHEHVGERGGHRVGVHARQRADPACPQYDHGAQREQVERVQPEHAAHPETADAALALQRRGHDIAADEEEHEDAVLAGVEPVIDRIPHRLEDGVGQVVEYHAQRGDPAQCVQPGEPPSGCGPGGADLWL